nr:MAG TPA: hypothetical protein [Caudoviricetes sp.]
MNLNIRNKVSLFSIATNVAKPFWFVRIGMDF